MAIRDIGVKLVVTNLGGFLRSMDRYNTAIDKAESKTQRFGERAQRVGRVFALLGAPIVAFGALSVRAATQFDTALVGVAKTTNATDAELAVLGAQFRSLALDIPVAAAELANIGETAGRLGVEVQNIPKFTETVAALGVATNLSTESAAQFLARIQAITSLPADQIENFGSALVDLGNNTATSEAEIAAFTLRMSGAANVAGLSQAEILGVAASFSELGVRAERGGTAVQKVLFTMIEAINTAGPELDTFAAAAGVTAEEFATLFEEDAGEAFTRFVEGLGRSGTEAFSVLSQLGLADQRLAQAFITVGNAGETLRENIELSTVAFAENTALVIEAERRYASAASQFKILLNNLTELAIVVGNVLLPPLLELVEVIIPVIQRLAEFAEGHPTLTKVVIASGLALVALGGALIAIGIVAPAIVTAFGLIAGAVGFLIPLFAGLSLAMGPITLIALGIAAAIAVGILVWKNWAAIVDNIKAQVNNLIDVLNLLIKVFFKLNPLLFALESFGIISAPEIPTFGHGGTQQRSGLAIVGERGPELVNLPAGATVSPVSNVTNNNITANYTNPQEPQSIRLDLEAIAFMTGG